MTKTFAAAALAATLTSFGASSFVSAQTLHPIRAETLDLGSTRGSAYYVPKQDGYHLVATLFSGGANTPVRFNAVLATGQSASVSVPGPAGTLAHEITFSHSADGLVVHETPETVAATQ
jgi:hypothetical protein